MKMSNEKIFEIMEVLQLKMKAQKEEVEEEVKEDIPVFKSKVQYPLKGFSFHVPAITYYADFDEISIYSPLSMFEMDNDNKRRRKALEGVQVLVYLNAETWEFLKKEADRSNYGYSSKVIVKTAERNQALEKENERLHEVIMALLDQGKTKFLEEDER